MSDTDELANVNHDRLLVEQDGVEREVFNWVNVTKRTQVRGTGDTDEWTLSIDAGDSRQKPECVTQWLSDSLFVDLSIIVEDHDINSVDIESEEVTVL